MELGLDSFQRRPLNSEEEDDDAIDSDDEPGGDLYEYEEGVPEEESRKNNSYDRHDNYDYEHSEDFEGSSDDFIDANIQLALFVFRKLPEKVETRAYIVFPDKPEKRRPSQLSKRRLIRLMV
ncbi:hypothetical protein N665_0010s0015 [Sinapis alba]|nr:hypothetical protein N665_0010s0015 [Sinapis alba]